MVIQCFPFVNLQVNQGVNWKLLNLAMASELSNIKDEDLLRKMVRFEQFFNKKPKKSFSMKSVATLKLI